MSMADPRSMGARLTPAPPPRCQAWFHTTLGGSNLGSSGLGSYSGVGMDGGGLGSIGPPVTWGPATRPEPWTIASTHRTLRVAYVVPAYDACSVRCVWRWQARRLAQAQRDRAARGEADGEGGAAEGARGEAAAAGAPHPARTSAHLLCSPCLSPRLSASPLTAAAGAGAGEAGGGGGAARAGERATRGAGGLGNAWLM